MNSTLTECLYSTAVHVEDTKVSWCVLSSKDSLPGKIKKEFTIMPMSSAVWEATSISSYCFIVNLSTYAM